MTLLITCSIHIKWFRQYSETYLCVCVCVFPIHFQNDTVTALKKARHQYFQRCDELEKAKAISAKAMDDTTGMKTLDKRRKSKDEAQTKVNVPSMQVNHT